MNGNFKLIIVGHVLKLSCYQKTSVNGSQENCIYGTYSNDLCCHFQDYAAIGSCSHLNNLRIILFSFRASS